VTETLRAISRTQVLTLHMQLHLSKSNFVSLIYGVGCKCVCKYMNIYYIVCRSRYLLIIMMNAGVGAGPTI
jgi:hypothetical protein